MISNQMPGEEGRSLCWPAGSPIHPPKVSGLARSSSDSIRPHRSPRPHAPPTAHVRYPRAPTAPPLVPRSRREGRSVGPWAVPGRPKWRIREKHRPAPRTSRGASYLTQGKILAATGSRTDGNAFPATSDAARQRGPRDRGTLGTVGTLHRQLARHRRALHDHCGVRQRSSGSRTASRSEPRPRRSCPASNAIGRPAEFLLPPDGLSRPRRASLVREHFGTRITESAGPLCPGIRLSAPRPSKHVFRSSFDVEPPTI